MILVAGGTGLAGSAIVRALCAQGDDVAVMSHRPEAAARRFADLRLSIRAGDVQQAETLAAAVAGCDTIITTVQFPGYPTENKAKGYTFEEVDQRGTERLVAAAMAAGARRFIYLSGVGVAPDATRHWFRAKWAAESAVRSGGMAYTILRPSWIYGPEDQALNRLVNFARRLPFVPIIGSGEQRLQPIFVGDVGTAVAASLRRPETDNRIFELGGPQVLTMNEIVRAVLAALGKQKPLLHAPVGVMRLVGAAAGLLPHPPLSREVVDFGTAAAVCAPNAAREVEEALGITLTSLRDGLATYIRPA